MPKPDVGEYVARFQKGKRQTLWHLVESNIEDEAVTRCGRKMSHAGLESRHKVLTTVLDGEPVCTHCD